MRRIFSCLFFYLSYLWDFLVLYRSFPGVMPMFFGVMMPLRAILAAMLVAMCWGGNYTATKFALMEFPPYLALMLRFIGVSLVMLPFVWGKPMPRLRDMAVIALFLIVLQFACVFTAIDMGLSITSAVVAGQLGVPFACMLAAIMFKDYLGPWRSAGLMLAFFGVVLVAGTPNASLHWQGFALAVLGSFAWGIANMYMKRLTPIPPVSQLLFWPALVAIAPLGLLSLIDESGQWMAITTAHTASWLGIGYSLFFSSLLGYGLWNRLVSTYPMSAVVPYSLLVPIAGILGGVLVFHDPLTTQVLLGAALTIIGVGVISVRRPQLIQRGE